MGYTYHGKTDETENMYVHAKHKVIFIRFAHWSFHYFGSFKGSLWVHTAGALGGPQKEPLG